ncbi:hypothetical protein Mapa_011923 [Marchantia paleacea]|nr:hypothetical protein Mapa_011923 [Marchantia paleacea]
MACGDVPTKRKKRLNSLLSSLAGSESCAALQAPRTYVPLMNESVADDSKRFKIHDRDAHGLWR